MDYFKEGIEKICLYHLPGTPPINERCPNCLDDYDLEHHPNNFDCKDFFVFPQVTYEEVRKELKKRKIEISKDMEEILMKELGIVDTILALKRIKISPKKFVEDILSRKINQERDTYPLKNHEDFNNIARNIANYET